MNPKWTLWFSVLLCLCLLIPFGAVAEESGIDVEEEVVSESVEAASEELTVDLEGEDGLEEEVFDEITLELTGEEDTGNTFAEVMDAPLPELNSEDHQHNFDTNGVGSGFGCCRDGCGIKVFIRWRLVFSRVAS